MITVTVYKTHGAQTVRANISAPSIEEAVRIAGEGARLELPIDGELFFAPQRGYPWRRMAPTTPRGPSTGRRPPTGRASRPLGDCSMGHGVRPYRQGPPAQEGG